MRRKPLRAPLALLLLACHVSRAAAAESQPRAPVEVTGIAAAPGPNWTVLPEDAWAGGDPRCWQKGAELVENMRSMKEVIQLLRRRPSLLRNICCAGGNTADCWGKNTLPSRSSYTFARCCLPGGAARRGEPLSKWCPADARVASACCREAVPGLCPSPEGARSCCEAWSPPAVLPFPLGCGTRLWREDAEANIAGRLPPGRLEPLRAGQLDRLARHFYATGEVLPSLDLIQEGLKGRERAASDMCPEAAVLSALLELEKNALHIPVRGLRARLASLRRYWEAFLAAAPGANGTGARALDGPVAMAGTVAEGFRRLDAQLRALAATARDRAAAGGFKAHLLITVCLPSGQAGRGDGQALSNLMWKVFQPGLLSRSTTLYLYDVCYGFFPPGSPAYDLRNELEVELSPGPPAADAPPLVAEDKLPDLLRPGDLARRFERVVVVPFDQEIGVGIVAATMRHVAAHYDALPDLLLCFHPDVTEHVRPDDLKVVLGSVASGTWPASVPFLNLGHRHNGPVDASGRVGSEPLSYCRNAPSSTAARWRRARSPFSGGWALQRVFPRHPAGFWCQNLERSWELLFERPISLPEDDFGDYDFGQFAVTREAMRRRPVGFWQRAWRALCSRGNYQHLPGTRYLSPIVDFADSKTMSDWRGYHALTECIFEHLWRVVFVGPGRAPTRLHDPSMPLAFKFSIMYGWNPGMLAHYRWTPSEPLADGALDGVCAPHSA